MKYLILIHSNPASRDISGQMLLDLVECERIERAVEVRPVLDLKSLDL